MSVVMMSNARNSKPIFYFRCSHKVLLSLRVASLMATFTPVPLGVGNGTIPNDAIRASSVFDRYHVPSQARLNNSKDGRKGGAWKPKISDQKQYLEVDLGAVTNVMQVRLLLHCQVHKKRKTCK